MWINAETFHLTIVLSVFASKCMYINDAQNFFLPADFNMNTFLCHTNRTHTLRIHSTGALKWIIHDLWDCSYGLELYPLQGWLLFFQFRCEGATGQYTGFVTPVAVIGYLVSLTGRVLQTHTSRWFKLRRHQVSLLVLRWIISREELISLSDILDSQFVHNVEV